MLTQVPLSAAKYAPPKRGERADDLSGHNHRQVIGYLGLALPFLLAQIVKWRPNLESDGWVGNSISAYYWTGAVSLFVGLLAALCLYLLTYRGYRRKSGSFNYDRAAAIVAGVAAAIVALFPTSPPGGVALPPWWGDWISATHAVAAIALFTMFAIFSLWLFTRTAEGEQPTRGKKWRNWMYRVCGIGIVVSMIWALIARQSGNSIFWQESSALVFFAVSWLVKGRAYRLISSARSAASTEAHS